MRQAAGFFSVPGDSQVKKCVVKGSTAGSGLGEVTDLSAQGAGVIHLEASKAYLVTVRAIATEMGLGAAVRQTAAYAFCFVASVRSGGTVDVSAATDLIVPIVAGAAFVGATLVASSLAPNSLTLRFTIAPASTIASRIVAQCDFVEVLGT